MLLINQTNSVFFQCECVSSEGFQFIYSIHSGYQRGRGHPGYPHHHRSGFGSIIFVYNYNLAVLSVIKT